MNSQIKDGHKHKSDNNITGCDSLRGRAALL